MFHLVCNLLILYLDFSECWMFLAYLISLSFSLSLIGTVVDTKIVHPRNYDFYMCAHAGMIVSPHLILVHVLRCFRCMHTYKYTCCNIGYVFLHSQLKVLSFLFLISIKGTSRPAHYHVLLDEISFSPDDLQHLIHSLSYV